MIEKLPDRLFFILVALIIILIAFSKVQYFKSMYSSNYRINLFEQFVSELNSGNFDPEKYWEFRERFSPGTFLRDEENVGFFATFKVISAKDGMTPLFFYQSNRLKSLDALISYDTNTALQTIKEEFPGEIITNGEKYVLIKSTEDEYVFAFVESIDEMQRVDGMFDYLPEEKELLNNKLWYNATYLKVN